MKIRKPFDPDEEQPDESDEPGDDYPDDPDYDSEFK